jgi:hypothetical protein
MEMQMSRMLSDQSVREFRAWMAQMPPSRWDPPHVRGATDAMPEEIVPPPRYYNREAARRLLQFLATKLNADDLAEAWRMIQARLDQAGLEPDEKPLRRNGHAA